eukprot:16117258-Heterocapsa_arctica.AAC.1
MLLARRAGRVAPGFSWTPVSRGYVGAFPCARPLCAPSSFGPPACQPPRPGFCDSACFCGLPFGLPPLSLSFSAS